MAFAKIFLAWFFFFWAVMILVAEIYKYIMTRGANTIQAGDYGVLIRWLLSSFSFAVWYWMLFA